MQRSTPTVFPLIVAIADVSHYVRPGTAVDTEAKEPHVRHFPTRVIPMLPSRYPDGCVRWRRSWIACVSGGHVIDKHGKLKSATFYPAVMALCCAPHVQRRV